MARKGRRPGASRTREQIRTAARELFGEKGYDSTTIRSIAARADVDPALVHHYFGAKDKVFVATMDLPYDPADVVRRIFADSEHDRAESVVRFFLGVWEDPQTRAPLLALLRSAATNDRAADVTRDFINTIIRDQIAAGVGVTPLRASLVASELFGLVLMRYLIRVEPLASASSEEIVSMYAPSLRTHFEADD